MPVEIVVPNTVFCPKCDTSLRLSDTEQENGALIDCPKCSYSGANTTFMTSKIERKYCKFCGEKIHHDAVVCTKCGKQVEELKSKEERQIVINNSNTSTNVNTNTNINSLQGVTTKGINKWISFFLCLFFGWAGAHKFYEGKMLMGVIYLCTLGLLFIGWWVDVVVIFFKPDPYQV